MKTRSVLTILALLALLLGAFVLKPAAQVAADSPAILKFGTMAGVSKPYTGSTNPLRGINGGGLPWVLSAAEGKLTTSGKLEVQVRGLVIDPNDPTAIARGVAGTNPSASFKAIVSCQTADGGVMNVATGNFPATTGAASAGGGDAEIEATVALPHPCIAPLVFVASPGGAWFAVTGN